MTQPPRIDYALTDEIAADHLPRVLALAGFTRRSLVVTRHASLALYTEADWPRISTVPAWEAERARTPRRFAADVIEQRIAEAKREEAARLAEWLASPLWWMERSAHNERHVIVEFDPLTRAWASMCRGARGDDLASLVAWRLNIRRGQAAYRIARACGREGVPLAHG